MLLPPGALAQPLPGQPREPRAADFLGLRQVWNQRISPLGLAKTFRYDDVPVLQTTSGKLKGYFYDGEYIFKNVCPGRTKKYEREIRIAILPMFLRRCVPYEA